MYDLVYDRVRPIKFKAANDGSNARFDVVAKDNTKRRVLHGLLLSTKEANVITVFVGGQKVGVFDLGTNAVINEQLPPIEGRPQSKFLAGTVATTSGSTTITGTGTAFNTDFAEGDVIEIDGGDTLTIASVASATSMTATANASSTVSGKVYRRGADNIHIKKGTSAATVYATAFYREYPV